MWGGECGVWNAVMTRRLWSVQCEVLSEESRVCGRQCAGDDMLCAAWSLDYGV